jgi:hypothetical protein
MVTSSARHIVCADLSGFFDDELAIGDKDATQWIVGKWIVKPRRVGRPGLWQHGTMTGIAALGFIDHHLMTTASVDLGTG